MKTKLTLTNKTTPEHRRCLAEERADFAQLASPLKCWRYWCGAMRSGLFLMAAMLLAGPSSAQYTFSTIKSFGNGAANSHLIEGSDGVLYGTRFNGGAAKQGQVLAINKDGTGYRLLHDFAGGADGSHPSAAVIQGADGALYGVTQFGGGANYGVVFTLKVLFCAGKNFLKGSGMSPWMGDGDAVGNRAKTEPYLSMHFEAELSRNRSTAVCKAPAAAVTERGQPVRAISWSTKNLADKAVRAPVTTGILSSESQSVWVTDRS